MVASSSSGSDQQWAVVDKQAVPKERVRLDKDVHVEERQISDTVRSERILIDDDARSRTGR